MIVFTPVLIMMMLMVMSLWSCSGGAGDFFFTVKEVAQGQKLMRKKSANN